MPSISEAFPSNFLKADDLKGKRLVVIMDEVTFEEIGQGRDKERKIIISFRGKDKKLVCNKTNAKTIAKHYGDNTDGWSGQPIIIEPREVEFQGDMVWAIRVSLTKPSATTVPTKQEEPPPPPPKSVTQSVEDEDVPF